MAGLAKATHAWGLSLSRWAPKGRQPALCGAGVLRLPVTGNEEAAEQLLSSVACFPHASLRLSGFGPHPQGTSECAMQGRQELVPTRVQSSAALTGQLGDESG